MILEFGVFTGGTTKRMASKFMGRTVHAFDWFYGLPEDWAWRKAGELSLAGQPPALPDSVDLVIGKIEDTLPGFLEDNPGGVEFCHIDVDIYSTTAFILKHIRDRLEVGSVIVFDEFRGYEDSEDYEYQAFLEFGWNNPELKFEEFQLGWKLGAAPHEQAAFRLVGMDA